LRNRSEWFSVVAKEVLSQWTEKRTYEATEHSTRKTKTAVNRGARACDSYTGNDWSAMVVQKKKKEKIKHKRRKKVIVFFM
jgi:hypothetical protein